MSNITVANPPKALIVITALVCITVLLALNAIDETAGAGLLGSIVGYAVGNGIAARNGEPVQPILGTTRRDRRADDPHESQ